MKELTTKISIVLLALAFGISGAILSSCEGPEGEPGVNANETCIECHGPSTLLISRELQWAASQHAVGTAFERSTPECAGCHTSDGFREVIKTGNIVTEAPIQNPTGQNCRTCHLIHETYTGDDWKLTTDAPVTFTLNGETHDFGKGNLCANCHQPRVPANYDKLINGEDVVMSNFRWGTHYGVQSVILAGTGAYEIAGPETWGSTTQHQNISDGCVSCHMTTAFGTASGGHTMKLTYEYQGSTRDNVNACTPCHSGITSFTQVGNKDEFITLREEFKQALLDKNMIDASEYPVPGTYSADDAGVIMNWLLIRYDRSNGVHNPRYIKAIMKNSTAYLKN